jgi:hypothetical protein
MNPSLALHIMLCGFNVLAENLSLQALTGPSSLSGADPVTR